MMTELLARMTSAELAQFNRWFKHQHGGRPSDKTLRALLDNLDGAKYAFDLAECERSETLRWEREREMAMRGWEARSQPRPGKRGHNAR